MRVPPGGVKFFYASIHLSISCYRFSCTQGCGEADLLLCQAAVWDGFNVRPSSGQLGWTQWQRLGQMAALSPSFSSQQPQEETWLCFMCVNCIGSDQIQQSFTSQSSVFSWKETIWNTIFGYFHIWHTFSYQQPQKETRNLSFLFFKVAFLPDTTISTSDKLVCGTFIQARRHISVQRLSSAFLSF